jgi:hypothetical protein
MMPLDLYLKSKDDLKLSGNSDKNGKESNKPDYDENKDQLKGEQEEETGKTTTNCVF